MLNIEKAFFKKMIEMYCPYCDFWCVVSPEQKARGALICSICMQRLEPNGEFLYRDVRIDGKPAKGPDDVLIP